VVNLPSHHLDVLRQRALQDGGFSGKIGGQYRSDATAWAILALVASGSDSHGQLIQQARNRLVANQLEDGRISISREEPEAFWPTPLGIMAWQGSPEHRQAQLLAARFLLNTGGLHWKKSPDSPLAHDTQLRGWSWTINTHSWVEPTALCLLALQGTREHLTGGEALLLKEREEEATRMILNRMLPKGGWNQGGTFVFGQELRPTPDSTGIALNVLAGSIPRQSVQKSLNYLRNQVKQVRTPLSLGWGILGLRAWGDFFWSDEQEVQGWIVESLQRQQRWGEYDTAQLSLLLVAMQARGGLLSIFKERKELGVGLENSPISTSDLRLPNSGYDRQDNL
jgi:hypothetical protein